jgi:predicted DNA-binding transcriptional regulator YafY
MEILILAAIGWGIYFWVTRGASKRQPPSTIRPPRTRSVDSVYTQKQYQPRTSSKRISRVRKPPKTSVETIIEYALDRKQALSFQYVDHNGELTVRTVRPLRLERRHENQILCLVAHCNLRKAERNFVVSRMQRLAVL